MRGCGSCRPLGQTVWLEPALGVGLVAGLLCPLAQALEQKLSQQDRAEDEGEDQFLGEFVHAPRRYFFWPSAGSPGVFAISSRMVVSACRFFIR